MKKQNIYNIVFGGIGGQGILTASEIAGLAAMFDGYHVKKSEVHGMAQRGGSVESHLRFGKKVFAPLVPLESADFLVCFYKDEQPRLKPFLKKDGADLTEYLDKAQAAITDPRQLNTYLVGVLSRFLPISEKSWLKAIEAVFKPKYTEQNKAIFALARKSMAL